MSDTFMDQFIADLVKGAERSEGFVRGGHVGVEVSRENRGREEKLASADALLASRYAEGAHAALERFGVKEAFLPLLGALAGGTLLRGGLGMAAKGLAGRAGVGGMVGRGAQGALNWAGKSPMRGAAMDMAGSMAGGAAGSMLQGGGQ